MIIFCDDQMISSRQGDQILLPFWHKTEISYTVINPPPPLFSTIYHTSNCFNKIWPHIKFISLPWQNNSSPLDKIIYFEYLLYFHQEWNSIRSIAREIAQLPDIENKPKQPNLLNCVLSFCTLWLTGAMSNRTWQEEKNPEVLIIP